MMGWRSRSGPGYASTSPGECQHSETDRRPDWAAHDAARSDSPGGVWRVTAQALAHGSSHGDVPPFAHGGSSGEKRPCGETPKRVAETNVIKSMTGAGMSGALTATH
jgi:hypothetical protein